MNLANAQAALRTPMISQGDALAGQSHAPPAGLSAPANRAPQTSKSGFG